MPPLNLRIAIAQIPMHWELAANVQSMKRAMAVAKADGAYLVAFSELAITGFHRRIVEWAKPEIIGSAIAELQHTVAALGIAAVFGAPTFAASGERFNSHLFVAASGALVGTVSKAGLTEPEATFFSRGSSRPTFGLGEVVCSAVICREIEDHAHVVDQLANTGVQVLFWPGQMRPDPAKPVQDPPEYVAQAQSLAVATGAYIVQTNWPNALNRPEESENTGHSACVAPTGELLFRLPMQGFGVGSFTLGQRAYSWYPCAA
jgi:predicted amidohydrolase